MGDILVIKSNYKINNKDFESLREAFINMKAEGVVVIPLGFDVIVAPEDVEIKLETNKICDGCIYYKKDNSLIAKSLCHMCKRNPKDNRVDWFKYKEDWI